MQTEHYLPENNSFTAEDKKLTTLNLEMLNTLQHQKKAMDFKKPNQLGVGKSFVVENPFLKKSAGKVNQSLDLTSGRLP